MLAMLFGSGRGKPSRSASSIVADRSVGYHDLKIDGCALTVGAPAPQIIDSCPFTVGGHRWRILFDPMGACTEYVSLYIFLDETVAESVTAQVQFSVMERALFFVKWKKKVLSTGTSWGRVTLANREALRRMARGSGGGSVTIRCDISVFNAFRVEAAAAPNSKLSPVPPPELQKHLGDLLQSGRSADVVFEVDGGERIRAHRCVLAARLPMIISAELLGEGTPREGGGTGAVRVQGVEAPVLRALLQFAYTDALPATNKGEDQDQDALYANLLAAADRFSSERLKLMCANMLSERINVGTVKTSLALAGRHRCDSLKEACLDFLVDPANLRAAIVTNGL